MMKGFEIFLQFQARESECKSLDLRTFFW